MQGMRIGIDARFYGPRTGGGGLGRYVAELVNHLEAIDSSNEYVLFLRKENFHECRVKRPNFTKRLVDIPWYSLAEQRELPREIIQSGVHTMLFPHWNVPVFSKIPFIVTIHDLILLEDPQSAHSTTRNAFVHGLKYAGFRVVLENAIHRSRHIIAISEYTKRGVLKHFRIKPQKVTVVHNGVPQPTVGKDVVLRNLGVVEPYILAVGNRYPHKNLDTLIRAFVPVVERQPHASLVLAGRNDAFTERLRKLVARLGLKPESVRFVDLPSDEELGALYRHAAMLAFPSRLEGFGIPPLEAMHCGIPVMSSNAASLPEVLGDAARYVDPDDEQGMTRVMIEVLEHPERFESLVEEGYRQSGKFSWQKTAQKTLEIYLAHGIRRL